MGAFEAQVGRQDETTADVFTEVEDTPRRASTAQRARRPPSLSRRPQSTTGENSANGPRIRCLWQHDSGLP